MNTLQVLLILGIAAALITPVTLVLLAIEHQSIGANARRVRLGLFGVAATLCITLISVRLGLMGMVEAYLGQTVDLLSVETEPSSYTPLPMGHQLSGNKPGFLARPYPWQPLPLVAPSPVDNPATPEKVALGRALFHDKRLSVDGSVSCASCHDVEGIAGADGRQFSVGVAGKTGDRNAPTVWNSAFQRRLFWDGRSTSLEDQALQPMLNPVEMGMASEQAIIDRVSGIAEYRDAFGRVFGDVVVTIHRITQAIAAYERTLVTADTPYDDFVRGDRQALTPQQLNGMVLFEQQGCVLCHYGPNFSAASRFDGENPFRFFPAVSSPLLEQYQFEEAQAWRVPSLRNVALTGPWFHNGSVDDLREAVGIMSIAQLGKRAQRRFSWSEESNELNRLENPLLTEQEIDDIVAFLHALSSKRLALTKKLEVTTASN